MSCSQQDGAVTPVTRTYTCAQPCPIDLDQNLTSPGHGDIDLFHRRSGLIPLSLLYRGSLLFGNIDGSHSRSLSSMYDLRSCEMLDAYGQTYIYLIQHRAMTLSEVAATPLVFNCTPILRIRVGAHLVNGMCFLFSLHNQKAWRLPYLRP